MIQYHEALNKIISNAILLGNECVTLNNVYNRILSENVYFDTNMPPFNKSAMDGYACRKEDLHSELTLIETIYAGKQPENEIGKNQCAKIMTGAVVPRGADMVFMFEQSREMGDNKIKCTNLESNINICYVGEDVKKGDLALAKSTLIRPKHIPILASAGIYEPKVYRQPKIAVFATGTELVEPHETPLPHQIRNSNSPQTIAQLAEMGIGCSYLGIISDDATETETKIKTAVEENDITILSGGVSTGDFDFIPATLNNLGFEIIVHESAVQPGRPIVFARKGNKYCFGFAGNPVSSFIQFNIYLKPFLYALMGHSFQSHNNHASLNFDYKRTKTSRMKLIPGIVENGMVDQVNYNGSGHIHALADANCLIEIPLGTAEIKKGTRVNVRPI